MQCTGCVSSTLGFQDVAALLSSSSFYALFLGHYGSRDGLRAATCLRSVVDSRQRLAVCEAFPPAILLLWLLNFVRSEELDYNKGEPSFVHNM